MTGLERNSDIVINHGLPRPSVVNASPGGMQWLSDLVGYDALYSYGSPSYYARVMLSNHLGYRIPASKLDTINPRWISLRCGASACFF